MDDQILIKTDGMPTYNFANVIDDHLMGITHVMRGMEYLSSTPKYNLLYEAFGWEIPQYIHMPPVMRDSQHKLSKRDGDAYFSDYVDKGYLVEAIVNYLALVGWNPGDDREFFTLDELVEAFDIHRINKAPGIFDVKKLTWFNAEYIRRLTSEKYLEMVTPWFDKVFGDSSKMDYKRLAELMQGRTEVFNLVPDMVRFLAQLPDYDSESSALVKMYLRGDFGKDPGDVNAYAASAFYAVDRFANYKMKWKSFYDNGDIIISDRYATSNAYHQATKIEKSERAEFFKWLEDFEYGLIGVPKPDAVIYLDMPIEISQKMMSERYHGDETKKDIHESNLDYLYKCRDAALDAAEKMGWYVVKCNDGDSPRSIESIGDEIYSIISTEVL